MRKMWQILSLAAMMASVFAADPARADVVDKILVVVNNEVITLSEVDALLKPIVDELRLLYQGEELERKAEGARVRIVEQLIEQKLILSAARKDAMTVTDLEIADRIEEVRKNFPSREEFENAMKAEGVSLTVLKGRYKEQIMTRKFVDKKVVSKVTISPLDAQHYYNTHPEEFGEPEKVKLSGIFIPLKERLPGITKPAELAKELSARLKAGEDFAVLAKKYSEGPGADAGGAMGYVKRGDLKKETEDMIFAMKSGEISNPVQTDMGYYLFRVEEIMSAKTVEFSEVRARIEDKIFRERVNQGIRALVKDLKKNAYIAFK